MSSICEIITISDCLSRDGYNSEALMEQNSLEEKRTNLDCPIFLDELNYETCSIRKLDCGHHFHIECILIWFKQK